MTRRCEPYAELVGAQYWLPTEPFEYGWAPLVGCNRLRCGRCGQPVQMHVLDDGVRRHYECSCQKRDEIWRCRLDEDDSGELTGRPLGWSCDGHPDFDLPARLDGVALADDGDWMAVARMGLAQPPFRPPHVERAAPWITRLYRLLASEIARQRLGEAVAVLVGDPDVTLVAGALDFFINEPAAAGAERLATQIPARRVWLNATRHPERPGSSLLETAALALHQRLVIVDDDRRLVDRRALALAEDLALGGIGPGSVPYTFHKHDPDWLWDHADALVRANDDWLGRITQLSANASPARRLRALRAIAALDARIYRSLCAEIIDSFEDPERSALLSSIAPPPGG